MVQKTFNLHFGSGIVAEEAQSSDEYKTSTIQLLSFTEGPATGNLAIRFCYYSHRGTFQRSPLILDESSIPDLRKEIRACPKLHALLSRLVD